MPLPRRRQRDRRARHLRDGSRILLGQKVATDADGNVYWHLYMDVNDSSHTIDLTPARAARHGVLYRRHDRRRLQGLLHDHATSSRRRRHRHQRRHLSRRKSPTPSATLTRVSTGTGGHRQHRLLRPGRQLKRRTLEHVGSAANCDAVAIGGGGGVAAGDGSIYFLSPGAARRLRSNGADRPGPAQPLPRRPGSPPHFIATLDPDDPLVLDSVKEAADPQDRRLPGHARAANSPPSPRPCR